MTQSIILFMLTVVSYISVKKLYKKWPYILLQPILICPLILIAVLVFTHIPFETFNKGTQFLGDLLVPATVALAIPLYKHYEVFKKYGIELISSVLAGTCTAIITSYVFSALFHLSPSIVNSMVPRSVTTPVAMDIAEALGGNRTLSAVFVILTAIVGISFGPLIIRGLSLRSSIAKGALFGTAAHGIGTRKAFEFGNLEGTYSSISMILSAIVSLILVPIIIPLLEKWM